MAKWEAEWTGHYPCLCSGEWKLFKDGNELDIYIPFHKTHAGTLGIYSSWSFGDDWCEEWDEYEDGLDCNAWCEEYSEWLTDFAPVDEWEYIFYAFQAKDWRHGSCGGCI